MRLWLIQTGAVKESVSVKRLKGDIIWHGQELGIAHIGMFAEFHLLEENVSEQSAVLDVGLDVNSCIWNDFELDVKNDHYCHSIPLCILGIH